MDGSDWNSVPNEYCSPRLHSGVWHYEDFPVDEDAALQNALGIPGMDVRPKVSYYKGIKL